MGNRVVQGLVVASLSLLTQIACSDKKDAAKLATPSPSAVASAPAQDPADAPPGRCKASGDAPVELGKIIGDAFGFAGDGARLYYSSWDIYGSRGNLGSIRKDGNGALTMASLDLEPRGLAVDATRVFFTSGIRLMAVPLPEGALTTLDSQFSAQSIAAFKDAIYGVPADYGPYDRVAKIPKQGGETKEIGSGKRPPGAAPNGYSAVAVDDSGVYITASGQNRVLRFPHDGGKATILASGQEKAFSLALTGTSVVFSLAKKGHVMVVPKAGGAARKVASGLVPMSRLAADDAAIYAVLAGKTEQDPQIITRIAPDGSVTAAIASVPASETVQAIALDGDCVYWVGRKTASNPTVYAHAR